MLQADSCCKSSHSWRASGSPRLICRTSNITNHLGLGNTSLSSSLSLCLFSCLSLFFLFFPLSLSPSCLLSCSLSNSSSLVFSLTCSAGKQVKNTEHRDGIVLFLSLCPRKMTAVMMTLEMRGRYRLSSFLSSLIVSIHFAESVNTTVTHTPRLFHPVRI